MFINLVLQLVPTICQVGGIGMVTNATALDVLQTLESNSLLLDSLESGDVAPDQEPLEGMDDMDIDELPSVDSSRNCNKYSLRSRIQKPQRLLSMLGSS